MLRSLAAACLGLVAVCTTGCGDGHESTRVPTLAEMQGTYDATVTDASGLRQQSIGLVTGAEEEFGRRPLFVGVSIDPLGLGVSGILQGGRDRGSLIGGSVGTRAA